MLDLVAGVLLAWASAVTDLPVPEDQRPVVVEKSREEIARIVYDGPPPDNGIPVGAVYDHIHDEIVIPIGTEFDTPYEFAMLGHELIHWLQFKNGLDEEVRCLAELERLAYSHHLDLMWLMGVENPMQEAAIDIAFHWSRLTSCPQ